jgi:cytochrome c biogenesis protein CcmG/thiol:disulfide interchange protein DsbE
MLRYIVLIAAFIGLVAMFSIGLTRDPSELPSPYINKAAPTFELPRLQDPDASLSNADLDGEMSLVNVWATWCAGCREEHPYLMQLAEKSSVKVYGINWRDNRAEALRWLQQYGDPYVATGYDGDGKVGIDWGVYGAPETFLIDERGVVLHKHLGPLTATAWQRDFVPLLNRDGEGK